MSQSGRIVAYLFAAAMVAAPFIALIYSVNAGLAVMCLALLATAYAAHDASRAAAPELARRLTLLAGVNGLLGLIAAGLLIARLSGVF